MTKRLAGMRSTMRGWARGILREVPLGAEDTAPTRRSPVVGGSRLRQAGWIRYLRMTRLREAGMTTAEYAIGTLAACGFAALLVTILRGSVVQGLLLGIIKRALALGG
jgi:hypothetical protein